MMHRTRALAFVLAMILLPRLGALPVADGAEPAAADAKAAAEAKEFLDFKAKAEAGDVNAQYKLAGLYAKGVGTAKDETAAVEWYRKVAEQNDARGQSMLAVMYTNGRGVAQDYVLAMEWFRKAAAQNSAHAQYNLGHMYANGKGVEKDDTESAAWYRKAAEQNDENSQRILGALYVAGRGVPQDLVQAYAWTKVSQRGPTSPAQPQLEQIVAQMKAEQKTAGEKLASEIAARIAELKKP